MDKEQYYKYMFLSGAIWNFAIGIINYLGTAFMLSDVAALYDLSIPPSLIFIDAFIGMILIVGIGLLVVSRDLVKNHDIVVMFIVEKFLMFIIFLAYFLMGAFNFFLLLPVIVDLVYGFLFLEFYINFKG
ncbi:MAG: hypothetical protein EU539_06705 [Promethearchaeota archaeon]|nr:MAG: hypothetical protein EU539_06705 [Candidatus Lokiarchaeota archaeon]